MAQRWLTVWVLCLVACTGEARNLPKLPKGGVLLVAPVAGDALTDRIVVRAVADLAVLCGQAPVLFRPQPGTFGSVRDAAEAAGAGLVLVLDAERLLPDRISPQAIANLGPDGYRVRAEDHGTWPNALGSQGATFLLLAGHDKLSRQYAMYEAMRRLGARFYHPEQAFLPSNGPGQLRARARTATAVAHRDPKGVPSEDYKPDFRWRSYTFHASHPLEHLEAFSDANHPIDEAVRVNDWIVQNRGNLSRGAGRGVVTGAARTKRGEELDALRILLGFSRGGGITLHNEQQGASGLIDKGSPISPKAQIEAHVVKGLTEAPDSTTYGIHFGPTEFTVTPDLETVEQINWAGQKALELQPGIRVLINNHTTGSQPSPNFADLGCPTGTNATGRADYYDLSFHTDPRLGVNVHTVMFYPLEGPARVYNQDSFAHKLCLMQVASKAGRPLWYFPEGSWWLSFDNPIPVYLPLYMQTRGRDIELIKPLLASRKTGTLEGHRMFNSGHEWGYWQQDYAVGLWHWNADASLADVVAELFDPLCAPADWQNGCLARQEASAVLTEVMAAQKAEFLDAVDWKGRPGGRYAYYAGEDPADEIGAATGLEFRPVRVAFSIVAGWTQEKIQHFRNTDLAALQAADGQGGVWLQRLAAVRSQVPSAGLPWLDEVVDGIEINRLRARQAHQLYATVLAHREATLAKLQSKNPDSLPDPKAVAAPLIAAADVTRKAAEAVIRRREKAYRYPAAQVSGGGLTPQTAVANGTTYPWRVHTKTHLLSYWHNRHDQAAAAVSSDVVANEQLLAKPGIAAPGVKLDLTWPNVPGLVVAVTMGNGQTLASPEKSFDYGMLPGLWNLGGTITLPAQGTTGAREVAVAGHVARSAVRAVTPPKGFALSVPSSPLAQEVLGSLFPSLRWAWIAGASPMLAFAPDPDGDGVTEAQAVVPVPIATADAQGFTSQPVAFELAVPDPATGLKAVGLHCTGVVLSGAAPTASGWSGKVQMSGQLSVNDLVSALVELAGFDEKGAYLTLSGVLKFDPAKPPASVPFVGSLTLTTAP